MKPSPSLLTIIAALGGTFVVSCGSDETLPKDDPEAFGSAEIALTNAPEDVACVRVTVAGQKRSVVRKFPLDTGERALFRMKGLPVGNSTFSADAYGVACDDVNGSVTPTWYSKSVVERVSAAETVHVALRMIHNGRASVGVDFDEAHGEPNDQDQDPTGGGHSSEGPYVIPSVPEVETYALLTVGDSVNTKPNGVDPYRMVGIPDGMGAFDNGDGTFTMLSNHELGESAGIPRAHGGQGAFVSKWTVRKSDFAVLEGADLIQTVKLWDTATSDYVDGVNVNFARFCAGDLPDHGAFFDAESGLGYEGRMFMNGEETGEEGRGMAHDLNGTSWELPRAGKFSWENGVVNPKTGVNTVLVGLDDSGGGQVYIYVGTKTGAGNPVTRAGLTNGELLGLRVSEMPNEPTAGLPSATPFDTYNFGNVENWTGGELDDESNANLVSRWNRPEDGGWDPNNPNHFYFVTTNSFNGPSRLWRLNFHDAADPGAGGVVEMLMDGTEGQRMFDNLVVSQQGYVYIQEDPGGNAHLAKIWRYDIATDTAEVIATHTPALFDPTSPTFRTNNEEASGIIDMSDILGPGWFVFNAQAHASAGNPELVEGGQFLALFDELASEQ